MKTPFLVWVEVLDKVKNEKIALPPTVAIGRSKNEPNRYEITGPGTSGEFIAAVYDATEKRIKHMMAADAERLIKAEPNRFSLAEEKKEEPAPEKKTVRKRAPRKTTTRKRTPKKDS